MLYAKKGTTWNPQVSNCRIIFMKVILSIYFNSFNSNNNIVQVIFNVDINIVTTHVHCMYKSVSMIICMYVCMYVIVVVKIKNMCI